MVELSGDLEKCLHPAGFRWWFLGKLISPEIGKVIINEIEIGNCLSFALIGRYRVNRASECLWVENDDNTFFADVDASHKLTIDVVQVGRASADIIWGDCKDIGNVIDQHANSLAVNVEYEVAACARSAELR